MVTAFRAKEHQPKAGVTAGVTTVLLFCYYGSHITTLNPCCQVLFSSRRLKRVTTTSCLLLTTALSRLDKIAYSGVPRHADSLISLDTDC